MSLWSWVLIGLAAWFAPAVVAGLMLGWALWRHRHTEESPAGLHEPAEDGRRAA
jgi:uncharacterized membrane protein YphA (DoxX/SURF4 family)